MLNENSEESINCDEISNAICCQDFLKKGICNNIFDEDCYHSYGTKLILWKKLILNDHLLENILNIQVNEDFIMLIFYNSKEKTIVCDNYKYNSGIFCLNNKIKIKSKIDVNYCYYFQDILIYGRKDNSLNSNIIVDYIRNDVFLKEEVFQLESPLTEVYVNKNNNKVLVFCWFTIEIYNYDDINHKMLKEEILKNNDNKFYFSSFLIYNNLFFLGDSSGCIGIYDVATLKILQKVKLNEKMITKMKEYIVNENTTYLIVVSNYTDINIYNCQNDFEELQLNIPKLDVKIQEIFISDYIEDNSIYFYLFIGYENNIIKVIDCKDLNCNNNFIIDLSIYKKQGHIYKDYEIKSLNDVSKFNILKDTIIIMTSYYLNVFKWKSLFPIISRTEEIIKPNMENKVIAKEDVHPYYLRIFETFECPICIEFSKDSIQCHSCEQIFCKKCINEWKKSNRKHACPNCKNQLIEEKVNRNLIYIKDIMKIKCMYNCGEYITLKEMNKHFENCNKNKLKKMIYFYCNFCDFKGNKSSLLRHIKNCNELKCSIKTWINA